MKLVNQRLTVLMRSTGILIILFACLTLNPHVHAAPTSVTVAGSFQDELGCPGEWQPACNITDMAPVAGTGNNYWRGAFTIPAGTYNYKVALNGNWDVSWGANGGGGDIGVNVPSTQSVRFYYDDVSHYIADTINNNIAVAAGNFQSELGCAGDWAPDCLRSWMTDGNYDGIATFSTNALPSGSYEFKVATNESWDNPNYGAGGGGDNIPFTVPGANYTVTFSFDFGTNIPSVNVTAPPPASHDNTVFWNELYHSTRDTQYRNPGGPVPTGTPAILRLRTAAGDVTEVKARVWNDRTNQQMLLNMNWVATDGTYDWYEASVPASPDPTIYWYRFIVTDGSDTDSYEDDAARTGGVGAVYEDLPGTNGRTSEYSYQLTVYDPSFTTPDWVKNGVIYQIFPDRFRNGDASNDTPSGSFFYTPDPGGNSITRSNASLWNSPVCDPRSGGTATPNCSGVYSQNFYGGDLQGITQKIAYLKNLGVTVIYLNPIFESPSNHKYDTTDFGIVDDNFGGLGAYQAFIAAAHAEGMKVILDGVFNHTSSDSIYFDRYGRYASLGACESTSSTFRAWYYFTGVAGPCDNQTYESWFGYDSLPKLNAANNDVRDLIWQGSSPSPTSAIAKYWVQLGADGWRLDVGGDVDPGTTNDLGNNYWEGFRNAVRSADPLRPDIYIVGEEWGNATPWTLGSEWDATMNYQFSSAVLGFWRDQALTDNDHNSGSSAGSLSPITPSQLNERLLHLQEIYPPEAFYAMMNLLGSHDTNRALFLLDENADSGATTRATYEDAGYDWQPAIDRLKGVVLLQMTLPGAPTIYYGDEIGLVAPPTKSGATWEDDPYNRIPYPWLDPNTGEPEVGTGTPYYTHLQDEEGQSQLRDHYTLLANTRLEHEALRTGTFDPLMVDDAANVYVFGRRMDDLSDAAVVMVNRAASPQTIAVNVSGYLPEGAVFDDVLGGGSYTVTGGMLSVPNVPGKSGALLVLDSLVPAPPPPAAPVISAVEGNAQVTINWSAVSGADSYDVYRGTFSGGPYAVIGSTGSTNFLNNTGLTNGNTYYYVVKAKNTTSGVQSGYSNEVAAIPHPNIGFCNVQYPSTTSMTVGTSNYSELIFGKLWIDGVTNAPGAAPGVLEQIGFGTPSTDASTWTWVNATFNTQSGNDDEYKGQFQPEAVGTYHYLYRFSTTNGREWQYCGTGGMTNSNPYSGGGVLTVNASDDTTLPSTPTGLSVSDWGASFISLAWNASTDTNGIYGYDVFRGTAAGGPYTKIARVTSGLVYTDNTVSTGTAYYYVVKAIDTSFNFSANSNEVTQTAEQKMVEVTFRVGVPSYTPGTVYIAGDIEGASPSFPQWNPGAVAMTEVSPDVWEFTIDIPDGTAIEYKYTRGSWGQVESWGDIVNTNNRHATIGYGLTGEQLIEDTATNWDDELVPDDHKAVQKWADIDPTAPAFSSANTVTFFMGRSNTFTVAATGAPAPTLSLTGGSLPATITFNPATGVLSGTPTALGTYTLAFTASNGVLPNATQTFTLKVIKRPTLAYTSVIQSGCASGQPYFRYAMSNLTIGQTYTLHTVVTDGVNNYMTQMYPFTASRGSGALGLILYEMNQLGYPNPMPFPLPSNTPVQVIFTIGSSSGAPLYRVTFNYVCNTGSVTGVTSGYVP